jgi:hypothetical protein
VTPNSARGTAASCSRTRRPARSTRRDGLVQRIVDESYRLSFFAALTPAGRQRLRDARPTHNEVIREHLTRRLTPNQLDALGALSAKLLPEMTGRGVGDLA